MTAKLGQGYTITFGAITVDSAGDFEFGAIAPRVDVTSHSSPDRTREYIPGLKDPAEITTPVFWDPENAGHAALYAIQGDLDAVDTLTFTDPDGFSYAADAYVAGIVVKAPASGGAQTADIHWQTSGPFEEVGS